MANKILNANETKKEFVKSIYNWLMNTLDSNDKSEYKNCFVIDDNSIICSLPVNYFNNKDIPDNTKIEMKFITKRG